MAEHAQARRAIRPPGHRGQDGVGRHLPSALSRSAQVQRLAALSDRINRPAPAAVQRMPGPDGNDSGTGGLPQGLRNGIEALSGLSMAGVQVHRNSDRPAQLQAVAYTQGTDIHLAPGQDRHLPHEAWHIVQQMQGRVAATRQLRAGVPLNDDAGLEREADVMGSRAAGYSGLQADSFEPAAQRKSVPGAVVQRMGEIRFANVSDNAIYDQKAKAIVEILKRTQSIKDYVKDKNVLITLEWESRIASVTPVGDQVQISLSPWFFERQSAGQIAGMLAHEFAVHPLADQQLGQADLDQENANLNTPFPTGLPGHTVTARNARQQDHIFAAVDGQKRHDVYRKTVQEMAGAVLGIAKSKQLGITKDEVTNLTMTYLSDIAMILATNDHRGWTFFYPSRTASIFNLKKDNWSGKLGKSKAEREIKKLMPSEKTGFNVLGELFGMVRNVITSWNPVSASPGRYRHGGQGNALAETNEVQATVLADYGLTLDGIRAAGNPSNTLYGAINTVAQLVNSYQTFIDLAVFSRDPVVLQTREWALRNPNFTGEINENQLKAINDTIGRDIRILKPNGKMMGGNLQPKTIVWIREPAPHYRPTK